jgi:hypothetical protein
MTQHVIDVNHKPDEIVARPPCADKYLFACAAFRSGDMVEKGPSVGRRSHKKVDLGARAGHRRCGTMFESGYFFLRIQTLPLRGARGGGLAGRRDGGHQPFGTRLHWGTFFLRNKIDAPGGKRWVVSLAGGTGAPATCGVVKVPSEALYHRGEVMSRGQHWVDFGK